MSSDCMHGTSVAGRLYRRCWGHADVVDTLLGLEADIGARALNKMRTPADLARRYGQQGLAERLQSHRTLRSCLPFADAQELLPHERAAHVCESLIE